MGLLFGIFWLWVVIAGFKSVIRRIGHWVGFGGSSATIQYQPFEPERTVRIVPSLPPPAPAGELVPGGRDIWTPAERRSFGRKLDAAAPVDGAKIIDEMSRELQRLKTHAADVEKNVTKWEQELQRIEAAQADWTERATLAVDKGRDLLARAALEQRQKLDARKAGLKADITRLEALLATYYKDIAALEQKTSDSIRLAVVAASRLEGAEDSRRARELVYGERTAAAMSDLEQVERAADLAEGQAESLTLTGPPTMETEFAALEQEAKLDQALAELKARRRSAAA